MLVTAEIPDAMVPWIAEVFSETFPTVTVGLGPADAVKAVIMAWVRSTLVQYEINQARREGEVAVQAAQQARDDAIAAATTAAEQATAQLAIDVVTELDPPVA